MYASPCSEFPNDNPALHNGAILTVEEVCGPPVVRMIGVDMDAEWATLGRQLAKVEVEAKVEVAVPVAVEVEVAVEVAVDVEVEVAVDVQCAVDGDRTDVDAEVREEPALSRPSGIYLSGDTADTECDDIVITPLEPLAEAEIFGDVEEAVAKDGAAEACAFSELVEIMAGVAEHEEVAAGAWVRTLVGEGAAPALAHDRVTSLVAAGILLADGSVAPKFDGARRAWRAILRNESEDFGPCGALSLDEWAADAIARLLGSASRAAMVKRHLRDHGVAAFGLSLRAA